MLTVSSVYFWSINYGKDLRLRVANSSAESFLIGEVCTSLVNFLETYSSGYVAIAVLSLN
jgi:hypothetical protein